MQLTTRCPKYHQQFWPDHKAEGVDHVDGATLSAFERSCKCFAYLEHVRVWRRVRHDALSILGHTALYRLIDRY
jgi:hypothetical protein